MVSSSGVSHAGPVRSSNDNCFLIDAALSLFVVADGVGWHAAGEVASRAAIEALAGFIRQSADADISWISWPCGIEASSTVDGNRLVVGHAGDSLLYVLSIANAMVGQAIARGTRDNVMALVVRDPADGVGGD